MPNVMAAQPYIGGAICEKFCKVWLSPTARVPCSNAPNIGERKTWTHLAKFRQGAKVPENVYIVYTSPEDGQTSCKVWLASNERRRCSNEAKTRNPLKFAGVPQTRQQISAVNGPKFTIVRTCGGDNCCLTSFFLIVETCPIVAKK